MSDNPKKVQNISSPVYWLGRLFLLLIKGYKFILSPHLPAACRYVPSCSEYAAQAIIKYGPFKGSWLALKRIARCHPWGGSGYDPVR